MRQGTEQSLGGVARVGHQCHVRRVVAHGLVRVDIDAQQLARNFEATGEGHVVVGLGQFSADGQYHVGLGDQRSGGDQALGRADQQRVAGGEHALGIDGQGDRRVQQFSQLSQLDGRVDGAATGENQRTLGAGQQFGHARHGARRSTGAVDIDRQAGEQVVGFFNQNIQRNFNVHRTRTASLEQCKGASQHTRQFRRRHQGVGERRDTGTQCALVRQFMQLAATAAQLAARLHAGDHQHRDRIGVGLAHGGGDVGHARAGDDEAHTRFAAGAGVAVGHEAGALFMARRDVVDARTGQPAIQLHGVHPWNAEHLLDPVVFE
ncbi:hypothetical protein D3C86_1225980 [compost metagenome]